MAEVMADIETANAIVDMNRDFYASDSSKTALRESILKMHGVTSAEFDTSLVWYGHNLDIYTDVYENAIEILQDRQKDIIAEAKKAGEKMTLSGDSVDIWQGSKLAIFNKRQIGEIAQVAFSIPADDNSRQGDRYQWRFHLYNSANNGQALIGIDYTDGTSEYQVKEAKPDEITEIILQSDSTLKVGRVYGYMVYQMKDEDAVFADSLSLYRSRLNSEIYNYHGFQRKVK